jgi:DNA-binding NtrC family response regulator
MKKVKILVVCANEDIRAVILRLINANEFWEASGSSDVNSTIDALNSDVFDVLLLGSGLSPMEENSLIKYVGSNVPDVRIITHYGGGSGLLYAEIYQALS